MNPEELAALEKSINKSLAPVADRVLSHEKQLAEIKDTQKENIERGKLVLEELTKLQRGSDAAVSAAALAAAKGAGSDVIRPDEMPADFAHRVAARALDQTGVDTVRIMRARAIALLDGHTERKAEGDAVAKTLREWGSSKRVIDLAERSRAIGNTQSPVDGGALTAPTQAQMFAEFAFSQIPFVELGAMSLTNNKTYEIPFLDDVVGGGWADELNNAKVVDLKTSSMTALMKKFRGYCAASNTLLRDASINVDLMYRSMLSARLAYVVTQGLLTGLGVGQPHGLDWWIGTANPANNNVARTSTRSGPVATARTVEKDLNNAIVAIINQPRIKRAGLGMILTERVARGLRQIESAGGGQKIYKAEMLGGTVEGIRFATVSDDIKYGLIAGNQAGDGLGLGTLNKSNVYLGDFSTMQILIGDTDEIVQKYGAYTTENGVVRTGITDNSTVMAIHSSVGLAMLQRGAELRRIDSVDWQEIT